MTPKFQEEMLSAYLDEELTPEQQKLVEQELENSPEAERQLRDFQALGAMLRDLPTAPAPACILKNIQQQLSQSSPSTPQSTPPRKGLSRSAYWLA